MTLVRHAVIASDIDQRCPSLARSLRERKFFPNHVYLMLGVTGMHDGIVIVNHQGGVFEFVYREECFEIS